MKRQFNKVIGASVLAASLSILPLSMSAHAQSSSGSGSGSGTSTTTNTGTTNDATYSRDNNFDWGWLGLIGLVGLAGLAGRKRAEEPTRYRDPNAVGNSGYRE